MSEFRSRIRIAAALVSALVLSGCGGGGEAAPLAPPSSPPSASPPPPPSPPSAVGMAFALLDPGEPSSSTSAYAALSTVDGIVFRASWSALEPSADSYAWGSLDTAANAARAVGKRFTIHILPADSGLPGWLAGLGAQTYSYTTPSGGAGQSGVPWDAVYLQRYVRFMAAMADHLRLRNDDEALEAVSVAAPIPEMSIVSCQNGQLTSAITYDRALYLNAWKTAINGVASAFSNADFASIRIAISAPVSVICRPDNDGRAFFTEVFQYARTVSVNTRVFAADLNAMGSARLQQADAALQAGGSPLLQTIWSATNDPTNRMQGSLQTAVCEGWRAGARYFELYKVDLASSDPAIQSAVASARTGQGC